MAAVATVGRVRSWDDEQGWGVVDSTATPGGCWAHCGAVAVPGHRTLAPGQDVELEWEPGPQDGYDFRAVRVWPAGQDPHDTPGVTGPSSAYRSTLTLTFDEDPAG